MPLYDLACPECQKEWEGFTRVEDKDEQPCPSCGEFGITQVTCRSVPEVYGHFDKGLGSYVRSKSEESRIKKAKHLEEISPIETVSTTHPYMVEKVTKLKQANDYVQWYSA